MASKWSQKSMKIDEKIQYVFCLHFWRFFIDFGTTFGSLNHQKTVIFLVFFNVFWKIAFSNSYNFLNHLGSQIGLILGPKTIKKAISNASKIWYNFDHVFLSFLERFSAPLGNILGAFGRLLGAFGRLLGASWGRIWALVRLSWPRPPLDIVLGAFWDPLGVILGASSPESSQRQQQQQPIKNQNQLGEIRATEGKSMDISTDISMDRR